MMGSPESGTGSASSVGQVAWQAVCDQALAPMALLDMQGRYCYVNQALCDLLGYDRNELLRRSAREFTHAGDPVLDDYIADAFAGRWNGGVVEKRYVRRDGQAVWVLQSGSVIRDDTGTPCFFLAQFQDITARRESELLWQRTFDNAPNGLVMVDLNGRWTKVNDAFCDLLGYDRDELVGRSFNEFTYPDDIEHGDALFDDLVYGRRQVGSLQKRYRHRDGHPLWVLIRASTVPGPTGEPAVLIGQIEEIGNGRMAHADLAHLALHDPLTGLANRALLQDQLEHALANLERDGDTLAVLVADLDHLKSVNDSLGHAAGDALLTAAAHRLLLSVRAGDVVARLGGDEFVVASRVFDEWAAGRLRERVIRGLEDNVQFDGHLLPLRASVGLATTKDPTTESQVLLHRADRDMYLHKRHHPPNRPQ